MTSCEPLCDASPAAPALNSLALPTNAVSRGLSDLHTPTWLALLTFNVTLRTVLFHPLQLAIARKRVTRADRPPSVARLVREAFRGEVGAARATGGVRGVYRGVGAAVAGNIVGEVSYLHTMEIVREYLEEATGDDAAAANGGNVSNGADGAGKETAFQANSYAVAVGGISGDVVALLLVTPCAVVCNRQMTAGYGMTAGNTYRPFWATGREVWGLYQQTPTTKTDPTNMQNNNNNNRLLAQRSRPLRLRAADGCRGLYAGLSAGIAELPASGVWWGLYSETKSVLYTVAEPTLSRWARERRDAEAASGQQHLKQKQRVWQQNWFLSPTDNPALNATAGVIASGVTAALFNPISIMHTRLQALPPDARDVQRGRWPFARVRHIATDLIRREGFRGFYKGTIANVGAAVLDGVVFSLFYELTKLGSDRQFLERL